MAETPTNDTTPACSPLAPFSHCPLCDTRLMPEHAHQRCPGCGWRDSCCD